MGCFTSEIAAGAEGECSDLLGGYSVSAFSKLRQSLPVQKGGHCHLFWGHPGSHGGVGWGDMCLFGLAQQEFMEHLLWADWQEVGGSTTALELQKGHSCPPISAIRSRRKGWGDDSVSQELAMHAENLSSDSQYPRGKLDMVVCSSNPSPSGTETGGFRGSLGSSLA